MKRDQVPFLFVRQFCLYVYACLKPVMHLLHLYYGLFLAKPPEQLSVILKRDCYKKQDRK